MMTDEEDFEFSRYPSDNPEDYANILNTRYPDGMDMSELFIKLTQDLQRSFAISKGLLVIRENNATQFIATSSFSQRKTRKNLSLRIPSVSSLFEKVAEGGTLYTENCSEFFSGNSFERNLLMDNKSRSFILQPLKHEGQVIGILGYSSDEVSAFTVFETGLLDTVAGLIASRISGKRIQKTHY